MESECEKLLPFRQMNDWSCGVAALRFLMSLTVWPLLKKQGRDILEYVPKEDTLGTTSEDGTDPENVEKYLSLIHIPYRVSRAGRVKKLSVPAMVLFRSDDPEDHYGVVVSIGEKVTLFCPWYCEYQKYSLEEFESLWWTERYGNGWSLHI